MQLFKHKEDPNYWVDTHMSPAVVSTVTTWFPVPCCVTFISPSLLPSFSILLPLLYLKLSAVSDQAAAHFAGSLWYILDFP